MFEDDGFELTTQGCLFYIEPVMALGISTFGEVRKTYGIAGKGRIIDSNKKAPKDVYDSVAAALDLLEKTPNYGDMSVSEFLAKLLPD